MKSWFSSLGVYGDRRVLSLLFLGFSSGMPFGVVGDPLIAWLAEDGLTKTTIGLFALAGLPYSLKFLWAPLIDRLPLPFFTRLIGRRRGWALLSQLILLVSIFALGQTSPIENLWWTAFFAVAVAFSSASQDIVIDAYRIEILDNDKLAAGAALAVNGWRFGQLGAGAIGLILADFLPWPVVFVILSGMVVIGIVTILINPEPDRPLEQETIALEQNAREFLRTTRNFPDPVVSALAWIYGAVICPFRDFMIRPGWVMILLFILFYKFGDAILSAMQTPFFLELGFSKTEIAGIKKIFGFNAILAGGILGGVVLARLGLMRGLLVCGILMAASNLVFVVQALAGNDLWILTLTIAVENITTGMGTVAFVAYLSSLCHIAYTATQYALLSSFMAFSRTIMTSGSGWLADQVDWVTFFLLTTVAAVPGILLLVWMMKRFPPSDPDQAPGQAEKTASGYTKGSN